MAWNEPGGGKDPWGANNSSDGPPDIDEALKKIRSRIESIFGSGGGGGKKSSGGSGNKSLVGLILTVLIIGWSITGFYQVDEKEQAVVLQFGEFSNITMPGPHWIPRIIQKAEIVDVSEIRSIQQKAQMLTEDENIVSCRSPCNTTLTM